MIELLVVVAIVGVLAGLLLPALAASKQKAKRIHCLNNVRQLCLAVEMYAGDHGGECPRVSRRFRDNWMAALGAYYGDPRLLKCPSDKPQSTRSYLINGWNDYFRSVLPKKDFQAFTNGLWPHGMRLSAVLHPSDTILFGEKSEESKHVHMDFYQGRGNDIEEIDPKRHRIGARGAGGSHFGFVDGSVRFLKPGESVSPVNRWAVMDLWRYQPLPDPPTQ